jgi:predicted GH43/DUF377 family glycosyl hydrolase
MTFRRHPQSPVVTRADVPDIEPGLVDPSSVFNPGAIRDGGATRLLLRVQSRGRETFLVPAESADGVAFDVADRAAELRGLEAAAGETVYHVYDPRLSRVDGVLYAMLAADVEGGCRLGVARVADDLATLEVLGLGEERDVRNGVLFPETLDGRFLRLDRPNEVRLASGTTTGDAIRLSQSDDLVRWRPVAEVMRGRWHYWDELIGAGPPPIRTREGWLLVYHGVATHLNAAIYQAGVALLDLEDPARVGARGRQNVLEPRAPYELAGQVPNVVFPSGLVVDRVDAGGAAPDDALVHLYYGAADTCVGLATATVGELLAACRE